MIRVLNHTATMIAVIIKNKDDKAAEIAGSKFRQVLIYWRSNDQPGQNRNNNLR